MENENPLSRKEQLEIERLENDISFQKSPLKNPANWAPFATLIGTSFALIWAISTGWFTNQNDILKIERNNLLTEIRQYKIDSTRIHKSIEEKNLEMKQLADSLTVIQLISSKTAKDNKILDNTNKGLNEANKILNQKVITLSDKKRLNEINRSEIDRLSIENKNLSIKISSIEATNQTNINRAYGSINQIISYSNHIRSQAQTMLVFSQNGSVNMIASDIINYCNQINSVAW